MCEVEFVGRKMDQTPTRERLHQLLHPADNALCGGTGLEDREFRRPDEADLNLLGGVRIPDPTAAGDFCRRLEGPQLGCWQGALDETRLKV